MDLGKKIEEIRAKPEHIRERYLWISVVISMIFIFAVWIITFNLSRSSKPASEELNDLKQTFEDAKIDAALDKNIEIAE